MAKRKLERFAENATFSHMFQPLHDELAAGFPLKGLWNSAFFKNNHPLIVEVGCGKGEYTTGLAEKYPHKNFIGIDKKGARMWRGAKTSSAESMNNVAFVRIQAENITEIFAEKEVDEVWITFPEPQPKPSRGKKRFTSVQFFERYIKILKPGGIIHLKTDNELIWETALESIALLKPQLLFSTTDLYSLGEIEEVKDVIPVQTHYESIWLSQGMKIRYLRVKV